jgi:hypothetical protein
VRPSPRSATQPALGPDPRHLGARGAALRVLRDALGRQAGEHVELVLTHYLQDRDVLVPERAHALALP